MPQLYDESVRPLSRRALLGLGSVATLGLVAAVASGQLFFPAASPQIVTADLRTTSPATTTESNNAVATTSPPATSQTLTQTTDNVAGFQVEHPVGWLVDSYTNTVVIRSDACGSSTVLFYPFTISDRSLSVDAILNRYSTALERTLELTQGTFRLGTIGQTSDTEASALLTGLICGSSVQGQVSILLTGSRGLIKLYWTPTTLTDELQTTLTTMLQRYRMVDTGTFLVVGGSRLEIAAPDTWTRTEEAQNSTAYHDNLKVSTTVLPKTAETTFDTLFDTWLQLERDAGTELTDLQTTAQQTLDDVIDASGRSWDLAGRTITFTQEGTPTRAILAAGQTEELGDAALLTWRQAPMADWNSEASQLLVIEQSVRLLPNSGLIASTTGPFQLPRTFLDSYPSPILGLDYVEALRAARETSWSDLLLTYTRVRSPSDATTYLAPLTAQNPETGAYTHPTNSGTIETLESVTN